jgi:hypothetical protein
VIAGDCGMGGGTTYLHGQSHIEFQTGSIGSTISRLFYRSPILVFGRFRVKTRSSWGKAHVDHRVRSRIEDVARLYAVVEEVI